MSIKHPPNGFTLDFGSTLTILTTAAAGVHRGKGVFTGVLLDESKLKLRHEPNRISVSVGADYFVDEDCCEKKCNPDNDYGHCGWVEADKDNDDEWHEPKKKKGDECHKPDKKNHDQWYGYGEKNADKCHKANNKNHDEESCEHKPEPKKHEEFLILSLTCPSFPFKPGQIVWISLEQIVALTVICRN